MKTKTRLHGAPIDVCRLETKRSNNKPPVYMIQVTFNCGTYNDIIKFEYATLQDVQTAHLMWDNLIDMARQFVDQQ